MHLDEAKAMRVAGALGGGANSLRLVCLGLLFSCFFTAGTIVLHGEGFMSSYFDFSQGFFFSFN